MSGVRLCTRWSLPWISSVHFRISHSMCWSRGRYVLVYPWSTRRRYGRGNEYKDPKWHVVRLSSSSWYILGSSKVLFGQQRKCQELGPNHGAELIGYQSDPLCYRTEDAMGCKMSEYASWITSDWREAQIFRAASKQRLLGDKPRESKLHRMKTSIHICRPLTVSQLIHNHPEWVVQHNCLHSIFRCGKETAVAPFGVRLILSQAGIHQVGQRNANHELYSSVSAWHEAG